ncbi:MAG: S8 family serine peptidase [Gracilibacteraceae bacterium]|nr:S8 family serine peptidase [Gracilibacteraceae bacterium]
MISISSYYKSFKKIDPAIKKYISIRKVKTIPVIITFKRPLDSKTESVLKRKGLGIKYHLPFLNAVTGKINTGNFDSVCSVVEIAKIYFDGTAKLMGDIEKTEKIHEDSGSFPVHLSGKGITAAFIDSGVYPHHDLTRPRNRIVAFRDYINEITEPYDDNGHGTACIGAAFGASIDGKFKTAAYDCNIVCAKAFNSLGYGRFSDILAAMQWICSIKDKYNIKVLLLPFGCCCTYRHYDILSLASEALWNIGLFVCTCTGNLGPYEASIISPGVCGSTFTTGACTTSGPSSKVAAFSGRGPAEGKFDKPDAVMPGYKVTTLNADTDFIPGNRLSSQSRLSGQQYTQISGTSVAASMTAAAAALLYQKRINLSPADVKSLLKRLCISLNELKTAQGAGIIDIKKIEEYK